MDHTFSDSFSTLHLLPAFNMIDTNALLTIAFTLVSNFLSKVDVPEVKLPLDRRDAKQFHAGSFYAPTKTYLSLRSGTEFWIEYGVVQMFASASSHYQNDYPEPPPDSSGALLTSNRVVELGESALKMLTRTPRGSESGPL